MFSNVRQLLDVTLLHQLQYADRNHVSVFPVTFIFIMQSVVLRPNTDVMNIVYDSFIWLSQYIRLIEQTVVTVL